MKPYGLPRNDDVANPDTGDIRHYGLASHIGRLLGKGGVFRASFSSKKKKRKARRIWKRRARRLGRKEIEDNT